MSEQKSINQLMSLDIAGLKPSNLNPRKHIDQNRLEELAASVKEKGILQPLVVRPINGKYEIVCGERRFRAAKIAGHTHIPAIVRKLDDKSTIELQVIENLQREDVHPLEEAEGYEQLLAKHGYTSADDIAAKLGKSRSYVYGRMKLCDLTQANRKRFFADKFTPSVALLVARIPHNLQDDAGKYISAEGRPKGMSKWEAVPAEPMSYRAAKEYIEEELMLRLKDAPFDPKDTKLCSKAGSCTDCPKRTGNQQELFADIKSADVCTDLICFQDKKNAYSQRILTKAQKEGRPIVKPDQSKKIFHNNGSLSYDTPFIDMDGNCYDIAGPSRKYADIFKKVEEAQKHIHTAVTPNGTVKQLMPKSAVPRMLKAAGVKIESSGRSESEKKRIAQEKNKNKIRRKLLNRVVEKVTQAVDKDKKNSFFMIMIRALIDNTSYEAKKNYGQWKDRQANVSQAINLTEKHFKSINTESAGFKFLTELTIIADFPFYGQSSLDIGDLSKEFCKHYRIDIKKIEKAVKDEAKSKSQAFKPKKKTARRK